MTTVNFSVSLEHGLRDMIGVLRMAAERSIDDAALMQDENAVQYMTVKAQQWSQIAEGLVKAAIAAGDQPLRYADARYSHGGCPTCGSEGELVHVGREHYGVCHEHQLAWHIGANLFSGWRNLRPEQHEANAQTIQSYTVIADPVPARLCLACGLAAGLHAAWCCHKAEQEPELDLEVWGAL